MWQIAIDFTLVVLFVVNAGCGGTGVEDITQ
jgi:hypothetical protein